MYFMGEKSLGRVPKDHTVYMLTLQTGADPDRIRRWSAEDRNWLLMYPIAQRLASEEMKRRGGQS